MRLLNEMELEMVCGAEGVCTPGNSYGSVGNPDTFGTDMINLYEGLVSFTSHVIERVAKSFS